MDENHLLRNTFRNLGENKWIANPFEEESSQTASLSISEKAN
jgi:hypothetical protein